LLFYNIIKLKEKNFLITFLLIELRVLLALVLAAFASLSNSVKNFTFFAEFNLSMICKSWVDGASSSELARAGEFKDSPKTVKKRERQSSWVFSETSGLGKTLRFSVKVFLLSFSTTQKPLINKNSNIFK